MKQRLLIAFYLFLSFILQAQEVGLVLSGGGARGIAHIGVIQALEENGIPIDYITGTSMGAIVGGLYAIGMSPQEILELIKSEDFLDWSTGTVKSKDIDYFRREDPTPEIVSTYLSLKDSSFNELLTQVIPMSVINPIHLNFHFMELFGPFTAASDGNFDKLFVPFRCTAADIYTRKAVIFGRGDLENAIRASMSIPIVFNPVKVDSFLLFDGGLYNNYPIDIMEKDFDPDFIIGSSVSVIGDKKPAENDLYAQLEYLIMTPAIQKVPDNKGIGLSYDLSAFSTLRFELADTIYQIGYRKAVSMIDSIKTRVGGRRVSLDSLVQARKQFRERAPELVFYDMEINGITDAQKKYISRAIGYDRDHHFTIDQFKKAYYDLLSDKRISEIIPRVVYNEEMQMYKLLLDIKIKNNISFSMGGNVSSSTDNQLYANIGYHQMGKRKHYINLDTRIGSKFTSSYLSYRIDIVGRMEGYLAADIGVSLCKYYEGEKLFYEDFSNAFIREREFSLKLRYGIPAFRQSKIEFGYGVGRMADSYMQEEIENFTKESFDKSIYDLNRFSVKLEKNTLNHCLYPTAGERYKVIAQFITGVEYYSYPDSVGSLFKEEKGLSYFQISGEYEAYKALGDHFSAGYYVNVLYNNKRSLDNYMASIIQAPDFSPTTFSKSRFNEAFRANKYVAAGIKPIVIFNSFLNLQLEMYGFMPIEALVRGNNQETLYETSFDKFRYMGECSLIFNQPFFSASLFVNHASYPKDDWHVGLNIGFLLFPKTLIE